MSFDIKYDRDGKVITQAPEFVEVAPAAELPEAEPMAVPGESQNRLVENQTESEPEVVENQSNDVVEELPVTPVAKPAEMNWKQVRDRMNQAERRAQELEEALKQAQSKPQPIEIIDEDLSIDIEEDALAEGKHVKKIDKRFQKMQRELDQYKQQAVQAQQQAQQAALKAQLKSQYPDWDQVYNDENIARLELQEPEIYHALNSSSDVYKAGISAYKMIKQLGIATPQDIYAENKALAQKNAAKPRSLASISPQQGDSPLSKANAFANGLTDDLKAQMLKEMNDARKGY